MSAKIEHVGLKYLHLVLIAILALGALFYKFSAWLVGPVDFTSLGFIILGLLGFELMVFLMQLTWRFFEKLMTYVIKDYKPLGLKTIILYGIIMLGLIWTVFTYFTWLPLEVIDAGMIVNYWKGMVVFWFVGTGLFFIQSIWAVAHRLSEL